jgi:hypothetical protein
MTERRDPPKISVSDTNLNPDCECGYVIYLIFNDAKVRFATSRFVYCGEELFTINSKSWEVLEAFFRRCTIFMQCFYLNKGVISLYCSISTI